jgi:hypothetical protein
MERAGNSWRDISNRRDLDPSLMIRISSEERLEKVNLIPNILRA